MKVYGTDICIDCRNYKAIQKNEAFAWIGQPPAEEDEIMEKRSDECGADGCK